MQTEHEKKTVGRVSAKTQNTGVLAQDGSLTVKKLKKMLRADAVCLRDAVKTALQTENPSTAQHWLCDNYHLLETGLRDCLSAIGSRDLPVFAKANGESEEGSAGRLFLRCLSVCSDGVMPDTQRFATHMAKDGLCVAECSLLPFVLRGALLHTAANAVQSGSETVLIAAVRSLLGLRSFDFQSLQSVLNPAERLLLADPAGIFADMDDSTQETYRKQVASMARQTKTDEVSVAAACLEKAKAEQKHIGFFLSFAQKDTKKGVLFTVSQILAALLLSALCAAFIGMWWIFFLLPLPIYAALQPLFDRLASCLFASRPLFSMRVGKNIGENCRTLVTVSGLLPKASEMHKTEKHLQDLFTANGKGAVQVLFLADLSEADSPEMPTDEADIAAARRMTDRLNERFDGHFVFAVRPRVFSPTQGKYAGYERKRGALVNLAAFLTGNGDGGFRVLHGDTKNLKKTKYILTLDSDTVLSFGSLQRLCAVASHPLNRPQTDPSHSRVVQGYGIFVPAAQTALCDNDTSLFAEWMTHGGGMGAYVGGVSERNADVFGQSVFTGKGLIDVRLFYELCAERFPEQRILSHDVLEGGILRVGFEGRAAFAEHFPNHEKSYFERMHRWLRGDWQNAAYLVRRLGKHPLDAHTKWLLTDNLRRALTPVSALVLLLVSILFDGGRGVGLSVLALLSVCAGELFSFLSCVWSQTVFAFCNRGAVLRFADACEPLKEVFLQCAMLPQTAFVCVSAAVQTFWRLTVSKKNLLAWKTAAHSDRHADRKTVQSLVFPLLCAWVLLFGNAVLKLYALILIVHLPVSAGLVPKPTRKKQTLSHAQKEQIVSDCAAMWSFFEDNVNCENHFLPPDNLQETPLKKVAHRTSPTNIGLYLCCILAAADLAFIDAKGLCERVGNCLDTVESLAKRDGHLLNWYDTKTLAPLHPQYVSTVDSGNFVCCLTALREGLCEYLTACPDLQTQIDRIDRYLGEVDFKPLYDPMRKLFYVGMDAQTGEKSESCYDLYMSEARMTSYWCVSGSVVEVQHWQQLGRTLVCAYGKAGAVSWTGTFFEYFMPCIFMPVRAHSFTAHSLRFCLHSQQQFAEKRGIPWGITESGFYDFDPALNYNYKAHGVPALALKRRADCDAVVAPYASFLALPVFPSAAYKNLDRLRNMNMTGHYGFCEAADFTKSRTAGEDYCVVRSYMAHHVGMSFLSAVNCLNGFVFVQRFMRSPITAPAQQLLNERFPKGEKMFHDVRKKDGSIRPKRPDRKETAVPQNVAVFTNGEWTQFCDRFGRNVQLFSAHRILRPQAYGAGVLAACMENGTVYPLSGHGQVQSRFRDSCVMSSQQTAHLKVRFAQAVHPNVPASLFAARLDNPSDAERNAQLCFYLEPYLLPVFEKNGHPAYEKLFISCDYDKEEKIFIFTRRTQGAQLCAAVGFWDNADFRFETDREKVLARNGADFFAVTERFSELQNGLVGTDRCLAVCLPVQLKAGESREHTLIITAASNAKEAAQRLRKIRAKPLPESRKCAKNPFSDDAALMHTAENLFAGLFFDAPPTEAVKYARLHNTEGKEALWALGISGDRPLAVLETDSDEDPGVLDFFVRLHGKLCALGVPTDFVFLRGRSGGYSESAQEILKQSINRVGLSHPLGGLFALQKNTFPIENLRALCAYAEMIFPVHFDCVRQPLFAEKNHYRSVQSAEKADGFTENGYRFSEQPAVPWCLTYANTTFGCLCADGALGFTWGGSSHFNKITPWVNDTRAGLDGEQLLLGTDEKIFSLTDGASCCFTDREAMYEGSVEQIRTSVSVNVDAKAQKKRMTVHLSNSTDRRVRVMLAYKMNAVLGEDASCSRFVKAKRENGGFLMHNPTNTECVGTVLVYCSQTEATAVFSEEDMKTLLTGKEPADRLLDTNTVLTDFAALCTSLTLEPSETVSVQYHLAFARTEQAVRQLAAVPFRIAEPVRADFKTGDTTLDAFGNALLLHTVKNTRLFGRCGFYQCGGAWGFRDQLQDALCLLPYEPQRTRRQILRCAAVQFLQGDVLHWHHALFPKNAERRVIKGVRTRCSDDFLWLPYVTACYCLQTGDKDILQTRVPYLDAPPLKRDEKDRYAQYGREEVKETLYSHCLRAIARGLRFGPHGLSLMLGGDWNDAMGKVGEEGKGESVWLSMFAANTLELFAKVCNLQKEPHNAVRLQKLSSAIKGNIDRHAWENDRYLRAFFDDGTPLGSADSSACKLDVLPQAFSVFCAMPDKKRVRSALATAYNTLFDSHHGIVKLFDVPFTPQDKTAGYINFYPAGVRENGGQYTHAAVWFCMALCRAGFKEQAKEIAKAVCPATHYENGLQSDAARMYRSEPYAPCGDVASADGMQGRGGWSLYTGSAGWWLELLRMLEDE